MLSRTQNLIITAVLLASGTFSAIAQSSPLRDQIKQIQQDDAARAQSADRAMNNRVARALFTATPIRDLIDALQRQANVNIVVQWRALESVGITPDMPVDVDLRNVSVRQLLQVILDKTGAGELLTFYVEDNLVTVTTKEAADAQLITKAYDISDLLVVLTPIEVQNQEFGQVQQAGRGSAQNPFQGSGSTSPEDLEDQEQELAENLVELIQQTIRPEVWLPAGGQSSVNIWRKTLIVSAPRSVHERLAGR